MPTFASSAIPAPKGWDEFEEIVRSSFRIRWASPNLTRIGRLGQSQDGVDIHGEDDLGQSVGIQCKLVQDLPLSAIAEEVGKAERFTPSLDAYYVVTTAPPDAELQKQLRLLSRERVREGKFPVGIFYWSDVVQDLMRDEAEFQKHYPQFLLKPAQPEAHAGNREISLLDLGFYGCHIQDYIHLLFGEFSWSPEEFDQLIATLDACVRVVFSDPERSRVLTEVQALFDYVYPFTTGEAKRPDGWAPALRKAASIETRIQVLEYRLGGRESAIFKLGQYLGNWYHVEPSTAAHSIGEDVEKKIVQFIANVSPNQQVPEEIVAKFEEYRSSDSVGIVDIPRQIFVRLRAMLYVAQLSS